MLQGFNSMQAMLGLMPGNVAQPPMGVPLGAPPPPPPVMPPGMASQQYYQQQQQMMQQTVQAAQMTRFTPPPSSPPPMGGGFSASWMPPGPAANPFMAQAMGGMPGMPNPGMMTAPQYGVYRGQPSPSPMMAPPLYGANVPSYAQPFAPVMPGGHFMTPAMQNYQIMQARQAQSVGMAASLITGGASLGMGAIGSGIGTMVGGPIGGFLGGLAGNFIGEGIGGMMVNPVLDDIRRGRAIQNITSPTMMTGPHLNPFTGAGMNREAGQETARLLRTMVRDHDFQRTGFNTQDVMRITQLSADQGLLQTAQNPDQIARQVKDISKAVKALVQITGDPDVRNAIASLGQMRQLGFEGLGAQTGAVANRATFARMAGVSQQQMQQMEMAGAMQASQMGLSGATGVRAAQFGAGLANVAVGTGAVQGLALARAGGQQGLAQSLGQAQMSAAAFDPYLMAAVENGPNGMGLNMDAYRANMNKSLSEVMGIAGNRMNALGPTGMLEFRRRRAELGERALQQMSPTEQMMMPLRQAMAIQKDVGDLDLGSAFEVLAQRTGMSAGSLQALQQTFADPRVARGMMQQVRIQQERDLAGREQARREGFRTPGLLRRMGQGIDDLGAGFSDVMTKPFSMLAESWQRSDEEMAAQAAGGHLRRFQESDLVSGAGQRRRIQGLMGGGDFSRFSSGGDRLRTVGGMTPDAILMGQLGIGAQHEGLRLMGAMYDTQQTVFGLGAPMLGVDQAQARARQLEGTRSMYQEGMSRTTETANARLIDVQRQVRQVSDPKFDINRAITEMVGILRTKAPKAGLLSKAGSLTQEDIKKAAVEAIRHQVKDEAAANAIAEKHLKVLGAEALRMIMQSGDRETAETIMNAVSGADRAGGIDRRSSREAIEAKTDEAFKALGFKNFFGQTLSGKDLETMKKVIRDNDPKALAFAAALHANNVDQQNSILASVPEEQRSALREKAAGIIGGMDKRGLMMLDRMSGNSEGNLANRLSEARSVVDIGAGRHAQEMAAQRLSKDLGQSDLAGIGDDEALLSRIAQDPNKITNARMKAAAEMFRKGDKAGALKAFQSAYLEDSPAGSEVMGGTTSTEISAAGKDVEQWRNVAEKFDHSVDRLNIVLNNPRLLAVLGQ